MRMPAFVIFLTCSMCCAGTALSGDAGSTSNAGTEQSSVPSNKERCIGDPVGEISGNVYETVTDLRIPCPDIDLVFRRSYGSWSTRTGVIGYGWTHGYEWRCEISGGGPSREGTVTVYSAGESGPSDAAHTFAQPEVGESAFNADGYELHRHDDRLYSLVTPDAVRYSFNETGRLASISTWNGTCVTIERDGPSSPATRVLHSNGKFLMFEYGPGGHLERVNTPDPKVWIGLAMDNPSWSGSPVLASVVRHDGAVASTNVYSYEQKPEPLSQAFARFFNKEVEETPPVIHTASPVLHTVSSGGAMGMSSFWPIRTGKMVARVDSGGGPGGALDECDHGSVLASKTDADGLSTIYRYARFTDRPAVYCLGSEMTGGLFSMSLLRYSNEVTTVTRPFSGGVIKMHLRQDGKGREIARTVGSESRTTRYNANDDAVEEKIQGEGSSVVRARTYDGRHRVLSSGFAYGGAPSRFTTFAWDDRRNVPNRIVTPAGRVSEWAANGHDVAVFGAGTNDRRRITRILCTSNDHPYAIISPDGGRTDFTYGGEGYIVRIDSDDMPSVSMTHDLLGHVDSVTLSGPEGDRTASITNNWRGKPLSVCHPDGTFETFSYSGNGTRAVRHIDALGREDVYRWVLGLQVHAGRVIDGVTNALFGVDYDQQLNVVAITDPLGRKAESYILDQNERIVAVTNVEGQVMSRAYAVADFVSSETRFDGTRVDYGYDSGGNLASVAYPDETLSFTYDADGLRTSAANSAGTVTNSYDAATGWLDSTRGVDGTEIAYFRSNGGSVTSVVSVAGTTSYVRDRANRLTQIETPGSSFRFGYCGWNGKVSAVTNGSGFVVQYAYDIMDRVTNIAWIAADGTSLGGFAYAYDNLGRIVSRSHTLGNPSQPSQLSQKTYAYDDLDRLATDGDTAYTYDAAGNRMTRTEDGDTVTYTLGVGDRLSAWTGGAYTHDVAGNVTRIVRDGKPTLDLTWNSQYQLVSVATNGAFAESYTYDALGRRVSTTTLEGITRHVYDNNWQVLADIDVNGNVVASYVWGEGIDNLLAVTVGGATYNPLTDIQGTVWGYVDSQNTIVARWQYDAWGNVISEDVAPSASALATLCYRFQCREWSAATGLINFRMRWYDAETGRWISKDPIRLSGGLNLYAFSENDTINYVDAIGKVPAPVLVGGMSAIAGAVIGGMIGASDDTPCAGAIGGAAGGAVTGMLLATFPPAGMFSAIGMGIGAGALGGATSSAIGQSVAGKPFSWSDLAGGALGGALGGGIFGGIGAGAVGEAMSGAVSIALGADISIYSSLIGNWIGQWLK